METGSNEAPAEQSPAPSSASLLPQFKCQVCGRQDETVRVIAFPYVFSFVVATYRRVFSGVWCGVHQRWKYLQAMLITSLFGWMGVPFGFVYTPGALLQLLRGGILKPDLNGELLALLSDQKLQQGDPQAAVRCLEESIKLRDDPLTRQRLQDLYRRNPDQIKQGNAVVAFLMVTGLLLTAVLLGTTIGIFDQIVINLFSDILSGDQSLITAILTWVPFVGSCFLGLMVLRAVLRWAVNSIQTSRKGVVMFLSFLAGLIFVYNIPQGKMFALYFSPILSGNLSSSQHDVLIMLGTILARGGILHIWTEGTLYGTSGIIYLVILSALTGFSLFAAYTMVDQATGGRQRIQEIQTPVISMSSQMEPAASAVPMVWIVATGVLTVWMALLFLFPPTGFIQFDQVFYHINTGYDNLNKGQYDVAVDECIQAVDLWPNSAATRNGLGWAYYYKGDLASAQDQFSRVTVIDPQYVEAYVGDGFASLQMGQYDRAEQDFQEVVRAWPNQAVGYSGLGQVHFVQEKMAEGLEELKKAESIDANNPMTEYLLGSYYFREEQFAEALPYFQKMGDLEPESAVPHVFLATIYYLQGNPPLEQKEAGSALARIGNDPSGLYWLGSYYAARHDFEQAEIYYQKSYQATSSPADALALAEIYLYKGNFDEAARYITEAEKMGMLPERILDVQADLAIQKQDLDGAAALLEKAIRISPGDSNRHADLSFVYYQSGKYDLALQEAQAAAGLSTTQSRGYVELAFAYYGSGQTDLALETVQKAIQIVPVNDRPYYLLGVCYMEKGRNDDAIAAFEKYLELYWERAFSAQYKSLAEQYLEQLRNPGK
jgi:tetratricopeptide (TPR) repeat protein